MKPSDRGVPKSPFTELVKCITALDLAMKQPIVIGVYEDSLTVEDSHIQEACRKVRAELDQVSQSVEKLTRAAVRGMDEHGVLN
jgi:hypothetical protein